MTSYKITTFILFFSGILLVSYSDGPTNRTSQGFTGAPCEDGLVCNDCHQSSQFVSTSEEFKLIDPNSDLEVHSYEPGKLYNVEVKISTTNGGASAYGFQATALDSAYKDIGTWLNPSNAVQISTAEIQCEGEQSNSRTYIEHKAPVPISTFKIDWKAPSCDIGHVLFYFIGNAVNNNGNQLGDVGGTGSSRTYSSSAQEIIIIDEPISSDTSLLANAYINISSTILNNSEVILSASESINIFPNLEVTTGSTLCIVQSSCPE